MFTTVGRWYLCKKKYGVVERCKHVKSRANTGVFQARQVTAGIYTCTIGYSDYDVFLENHEGSRVYRCKSYFISKMLREMQKIC
jgi:hypothetical protein